MINPTQKHSNNQGQQITEFTTVFILVALGIILVGPFVIRAWNAHLKTWEDSIVDSYRDPLVETPDPHVALPINP